MESGRAAPTPEESERGMNVMNAIERDRDAVLAIPGVVDLAHGEDADGPHALVFVAEGADIQPVEAAIARRNLLADCRVVVEPALTLGA